MSTNKRKQSEIHPDLLFTSPTIHLVQPQPIPSTTLLNVEYPGILTHDTEPQLSRAQYTSLDRALSTLHPSALPSLTSSPHEALKFLSKIPNEGLKAVECRLGAFPSHPLSSHQHESATTLNHANIHQVYRAPLIGEAVPTHNIVIRIIKRTWRQKKRKHNTTPPSPAQHKSESAYQNGIALDPALFTDKDLIQNDRQHKRTRYTGRTKKEYIVEILGMATNTVRFRSMADFAFQPQVCVDSTSSSSQTMQLDPVMALHKALATMDLEAFQRFSIPEQLEDYQIASSDQEKSIQSNLGMVPPAFFSRMDVPFNYSFVQTPYSELRMVPTPVHLTRPSTSASFAHALKQSDIPPASMQRFVNRVRLSNIAPQPFRVGRDTEIPTKPLADVVRIEHRCDAQVLARLRELLVQRPVWSRMALKNQLNPVESKELQGTNEKVYFALQQQQQQQ
ncbi:uncharacterized protein MEPE_02977 [Melanopsichium pennsylvanicum]|uniref:Uncharacterized protein n=1 Tax=Melanopsichium pennsylvanicum TaxID=63383 RepID=A0AAJ5C584_9BASI|nr:uncharacterized protein MEPE_02977 [Melanopsichium pennsylvanicum]